MKKFISLIALVLFSAGCMMAEVPAKVVEILQQCALTMENPQGVSMEMTGNAKVLFISAPITMQTYSKGDKVLMRVHMKVMGVEMYTEEGCDGKQSWSYTRTSGEPDTLKISAVPQEVKNEYSPDLEAYDDYLDAKLKEKKGVYEITFSNPKDKETPTKMMMTIDADTYQLKSMSMKESVGSFDFQFKNYKYGVDDSVFVLDRNAYKCVIIEQ